MTSTNEAGPVLAGTEPVVTAEPGGRDEQHDTTTTEAPQSAGDAALAYAEHGWPIFPCRPDKRPFTKNGFKDATTDAETIRRWWAKWPNAQVAVDCGRAGIVVLDLDVGKGRNGLESFAARLNDDPHGCGLVARTPRGGRHYVYRQPAEPIACKVDVVKGSGIDVRGQGGYIVLPSPASPGREWVEGDPFDDADLCAPPPHVDALMRGDRKSSPSNDGTNTTSSGTDTGTTIPILPDEEARIRAALAVVPADDRDIWLRIGMSLKSTCAKGQAFDIWTEWSKTSSKYNERDQRRTWASIREYRMSGTEVTIATLFALARRHGWTDPEPSHQSELRLAEAIQQQPDIVEQVPTVAAGTAFPIELVSGDDLFSRTVQHIVGTAQIRQPALATAAALSMFGAIMGRFVQTPTGTRTNVYCLGIGGTGTGKDHPRKLVGKWLATVAPHVEQTREFASGPGVYALVRSSPSSFAAIDELGLVIAAATGANAPAHQRSIATAVLALFSAANATVAGASYADRVVNNATPIVEPCLSILGFTTPSTLAAALTSGNVTDGLIGRQLAFVGDDGAEPRRDRFRSDARTSGSDAELVAELVELRKAVHRGDLPDRPGESRCRTVGWTDAAADLLGGELTDHQRRRRQEDPAVADLWVRFVEHVGKVALIRAVANNPTIECVDVHDVEWAASLVEYCLTAMGEFLRDRLADNAVESMHKRVLRLIREAGAAGVSRAMLCRRTQWLRASERNDVLASLVEAGQVRAVETPTSRPDGKGRPTMTYFAGGVA